MSGIFFFFFFFLSFSFSLLFSSDSLFLGCGTSLAACFLNKYQNMIKDPQISHTHNTTSTQTNSSSSFRIEEIFSFKGEEVTRGREENGEKEGEEVE